MRSANKGLKDKQSKCCRAHVTNAVDESFTDLVHCQACGSPKLAHHMCPNCYRELNMKWKAKNRVPEL